MNEYILVAGIAVQHLLVLCQRGGCQPLVAVLALEAGQVVGCPVSSYEGFCWEG